MTAEYVLLGIGVILLLLEFLVVPGFGFCGIGGIVCIVTAGVLTLIPGSDEGGMRLVMSLAVALCITIVLGMWLVPRLHKLPFMENLYLSGSLRPAADIMREVEAEEAGHFPSEELNKKRYLGTEAVTLTLLRPAGKVRACDGRTLDVVSRGEIIEKDIKVRVTDLNGPSLIVERV